MSTQFRPIEIPPGVVAKPTKKMRSSNWSEVNFIRWRESMLQPMGGQSQLTNVVGGVEKYKFASKCKLIHGWFDLNNVYHIAYLCESNLYVDTGGAIADVTPTSGITPPAGLVGGFGEGPYSQNLLLSAASAWTVGATTITVVGNASGILAGQHVYNTTLHPYSAPPATAFGTVVSVAGQVVTLNLTGTDTAEAGNAGDVLNFDWYGKQRAVSTSISVTKVPDAYSLDNFGSILYAMTSSDSRLLMWDPAVGGPAVVQPAATGRGPVPNGRCFVVTQERFIMIFGSTNDGTGGGTSGGGPRRFAWCDQENPGAWDYSSVTSQAGFLDVEPASPIICAEASRTGVVFWTAKKTYTSRFLGLPYVYNYVELCDAATPWSPQSVATTSAVVLWMSEQGVFSYDGTSVLPVACMVRPWIDINIDPVVVRELAFAAHLGEFNEWWWFYPTLGNSFNDRAAVYNYKEGWWTQCQLSRSAGITSSYTAHPLFADNYVVFQHEVSEAYQNASMPVVPPFAETFDLNLNSGSQLTTVKQLIPDVETDDKDNDASVDQIISQLRYSLFYRNSRTLGLDEIQSPLAQVRPDGYVDFRVTGRDIRLRIDVASQVVQPFTLGAFLIDCVSRGDR